MLKQKNIKPKYIALAAITLDGKIARNSRGGSDWTSPEDKVFMRHMLDHSDAIIVGHTTYKIAAKPLAKRNCIVLTRHVVGFEQKSPRLAFCNPAKTNLKKIIAEQGYRRIAVLGGSQIYSYCLDSGMLDELFLTVEPVAFGKGIGLFSELKIKKTPRFKLVSSKKLNQGAILLHYKV